MENSLPQTALERIMEEVSPLLETYAKTTESLKESYSKTRKMRKNFLKAGIEHTKVTENDGEAEEHIMSTYQEYKSLLEERVGVSKQLLSVVNSVLSTVDQQLLLLDSQYDPKFGIQTQNPRVFKTNKNNTARHSPGEEKEKEKEKETYCICNKPAYGDMIACDAYHMESPWFHMECVGCPGTPKGHWLCPNCNPSVD
ncbi:hypothetical protein NECID01_1555 [Nematocida sp. AWRm77]|nr:hypothetical protein NECID01_1555 [Nematocida sp. AWRm77]